KLAGRTSTSGYHGGVETSDCPKGELETMFVTRRNSLAAGTLATILIGIGIVGPIPARPEEKRIADKDIASWVAKRVQDWQPTRVDRKFDGIGWVKDICKALRLAKKPSRPVFLFTHDGRIGIGRC